MKDFFEQFQDFYAELINVWIIVLGNQKSLHGAINAYWQAVINLFKTQHEFFIGDDFIPIQDNAFTGEAWVKNPFFNLLCQQYVLLKKHVQAYMLEIEHDDKRLIKKAQFVTNQLLDAISPQNFIYTNPNLISETINTQGRNLLLGLENLIADLKKKSTIPLISMADKHAFQVGVNLAATPGKIIYKNELMELIQYTTQTETVHRIPLLIIPPWINKYYILDLSQHNSLVRWLVGQGMMVFMISWVNPDERYAEKGLFNYLHEGPMAAIRVIQQQLQIEKVNTLGFCIGGTLQSMLLAYFKAQNICAIQSATFLAAMIDFSEPGDISVFIDEAQIEKLEKKMNQTGYMSGEVMASAFNALRASDLIWRFFVNNYLAGKSPKPFDILFWNTDTTNLPAKMYSEYIRWMYLNNDLIKPGKIEMNGVFLDVSQIDVPTFFVSTLKDHIAPWQTIYEGYRLLRGEKKFILGESGHIAGIVNPPGLAKYGYYSNESIAFHADEWFKQARYHSGSWWPEWLLWLKGQSKDLMPSPQDTKWFEMYIDSAPGSYVHQSLSSKI